MVDHGLLLIVEGFSKMNVQKNSKIFLILFFPHVHLFWFPRNNLMTEGQTNLTNRHILGLVLLLIAAKNYLNFWPSAVFYSFLSFIRQRLPVPPFSFEMLTALENNVRFISVFSAGSSSLAARPRSNQVPLVTCLLIAQRAQHASLELRSQQKRIHTF